MHGFPLEIPPMMRWSWTVLPAFTVWRVFAGNGEPSRRAVNAVRGLTAPDSMGIDIWNGEGFRRFHML